MESFKIFVVEDSVPYARLTNHHLSLNPDNKVEIFHSAKDFFKSLHKNPNLVFLDYSLPDKSGIEVLREIKNIKPGLPVVMVSGQEDIKIAINLLKEGAYDYIVKDQYANEMMWKSVNQIKENTELKNEIERLKVEVSKKYDFSSIVGKSKAIKYVFGLMEKASKTNITVSITGETGTGKEMVAKAIHHNSSGKNNALVAVNVTAIPSELIESELFGHEKGAFTGADTRRIGRFEEASNGTIFLDEIGELDLSLQAKLLRVLQEKELTRVGGNKVIKINPRVMVATHKNLAEEVEKGNFREDLYYRLLGLSINIPPLRNRDNDVILLAKHFLSAFVKENKMAKMSLTDKAQEKLLSYNWPGNVRELKAVIDLAAVMAEGNKIDEGQILFNSTKKDLSDIIQEGKTLKDYTRIIIQNHLDRYDKNVVQVAQKLDVGKSTIYRMIKNEEISL